MTDPDFPLAPPRPPPEPADPAEAARLEGRAILAARGTPGMIHRLRIEMHVPVARGARSDEARIDARELDTDTTAILVGRVGYDALNRDLPANVDPVDALLRLAAARRDPSLVQMAAWADQFTGSRVTLSIVAHHPYLPDGSPGKRELPAPMTDAIGA